MKTIGSVTFENARFSTARAFTRNIHYRIYSNTSMTCCKLRTTSLHTHPHTQLKGVKMKGKWHLTSLFEATGTNFYTTPLHTHTHTQQKPV